MAFDWADAREWLGTRLGEFGSEAVTYRDADLSETTVQATVTPIATRQERDEEQGITRIIRTRTCVITPTTIPTVRLRGLIVIDDVEWPIAEIIVNDEEYLVELRLERHELGERTRPGFRR